MTDLARYSELHGRVMFEGLDTEEEKQEYNSLKKQIREDIDLANSLRVEIKDGTITKQPLKEIIQQLEQKDKILDEIEKRLEKNNLYRFSDTNGNRIMLGISFEQLKEILQKGEKK